MRKLIAALSFAVLSATLAVGGGYDLCAREHRLPAGLDRARVHGAVSVGPAHRIVPRRADCP